MATLSEPTSGGVSQADSTVDRSSDVMPRPSLTRGLVAVAAAIIVLAGMHAAAFFVSLVVLSVLVGLLLIPLRARLVRAGVPAQVAVLLSVGVYVAVLVAAGLLVAFGLAEILGRMPGYRSQLTSALASVIGSSQVADAVPAALAGAAEAAASGAASALSLVGYSVIVVAFLLADAGSAERRVLRAVGGRPEGLARVRRTGERLRSYVLARAVLGFVLAAADTVVLVLLGIPTAFLWGVVAFLFGFVPNVGFVLALIPPAALGLVVGGPLTAILVIVAYSLITVIVDLVIQPRYIGSSVDLSPVVVTLSLVLWAVILGPAGALLAVPLTIGLAELADSFSDSRPLAGLLTENGG
jgi:AI-2 transport protein TqsA